MNNPFGIPDDLFATILVSAMGESAKAQEKHTQQVNIQPKKVSQEDGAKAAKELFDSYVKVGFTETQAFDLLRCVLTKNNIA